MNKQFIVLLSNGIFEHDFKAFSTKEEAEAFAKRVGHKWNSCVVVKTTEVFSL